MNRQEANKQILDMYNDSTYQELKAYYEKTTIFNVLGVERSETRHSAFLCWLLNANASHGLGEEPMKKLLRLYATKMDDDSSFRIMLMTGDYELEMNDIVTEKSTSDEQGSKGGKSKKKDRMDVWATMTLKDMAGNEQSLALVIENKIYSGEGAEQTERYHQYVISNVLGKDTKPVEIFLTPAGAKAPSCKSFIHISYQELLDSVILPLAHRDMPAEASQIISDYIRNLSKPSSAADGKYTILATSATEKAKLMTFYNKFHTLFHLALVAGNVKVQRKKECRQLMEETDKQELLAGLWHSNEDLFKVIISVLKEYPEQMMLSPDVYDNVFKETNRDTTKYNVIRQSSSSRKNAAELKQPSSSDGKFTKNGSAYILAAAGTYALSGKLEGQRGTGDFYTNEKDLLVVRGERIMCVKWWKKTDGSFQQLIEHVRQNFPYIQIEEY